MWEKKIADASGKIGLTRQKVKLFKIELFQDKTKKIPSNNKGKRYSTEVLLNTSDSQKKQT